MHITGILQGGVQFALRLEDRPGLIKEVVDLLRGRERALSACSPPPPRHRRATGTFIIRVKNLKPEDVEAARKALAALHDVRYVTLEGK